MKKFSFKKCKWYIIGTGLIALLLAIDLVSKFLVQKYIALGQVVIVIPHFLSFTYTENYGAAFNFFDGMSIFLICFAVLFLAIFLVFQFKLKMHGAWWFIGFILVFAGAIGNLVDRIFIGFVRDFISISFFPPIFNIADAFLVVGVICILVHLIFRSKLGSKDREKDDRKDSSGE